MSLTDNGERGPAAAVKRAGQGAASNWGRVKELEEYGQRKDGFIIALGFGAGQRGLLAGDRRAVTGRGLPALHPVRIRRGHIGAAVGNLHRPTDSTGWTQKSRVIFVGTEHGFFPFSSKTCSFQKT